MPADTPRGFEYDGRLDGGGRAFEGRLELRSHYGPIRRLRIRRAVRAGDLPLAVTLMLRNARAFDPGSWDRRMLVAVTAILLDRISAE
jgi:hypothetical protein